MINRKTETQLQQTTALRFSSSILTVTGNIDFQFSKFYNTNRALESISEHATMMRINQNKLAAPRPTLSHSQGESLTNPMWGYLSNSVAKHFFLFLVLII